jgi:hypothetical protein
MNRTKRKNPEHPVDPVKEKDLYDRYRSQTLGILPHPAA